MRLSLVHTYYMPGTEPTTVHVKKPRKSKVNCRRETVVWLDAEAQLGARLVLPRRGRSAGAHSRRLSYRPLGTGPLGPIPQVRTSLRYSDNQVGICEDRTHAGLKPRIQRAVVSFHMHNHPGSRAPYSRTRGVVRGHPLHSALHRTEPHYRSQCLASQVS